MPKVSVIVPVHNPGMYLRPLLNSLINQTLKDIEIFLIDDGSTDGSREILKEYEQKDNRIKVFLREKAEYENFGEKYSVDLGRKYATGEYVIFVDHDDELMLDSLENLYKYTNNGIIDVVQGRSITMSLENELLYQTPDFYPYPTIIYSNNHLQNLSTDEIYLHLISSPIALWACLIRNEFQKNIELIDFVYNDANFIWKLKLLAKTFCYIPIYVYKQNMHVDSTSGINNINKYVCQLFDVFYDLKQFINDLHLPYRYQHYFALYEFRMMIGHCFDITDQEIYNKYIKLFQKEIQTNPDILADLECSFSEKMIAQYKKLKE